MAAKEAIITTFKRLQQANITNVPIIIETNHACKKELINKLESTKTLVIVKKFSSSFLVKVSSTVTKIEVLPRFIHAKKKHLLVWARKMLPKTNGHLLVSTSKGILTHSEAVQQQIGGQILGYVY